MPNKKEKKMFEVADGDPKAMQVVSELSDKNDFVFDDLLEYLLDNGLTGSKLAAKFDRFDGEIESFSRKLGKEIKQEKEEDFFGSREEPETIS